MIGQIAQAIADTIGYTFQFVDETLDRRKPDREMMQNIFAQSQDAAQCEQTADKKLMFGGLFLFGAVLIFAIVKN